MQSLAALKVRRREPGSGRGRHVSSSAGRRRSSPRWLSGGTAREWLMGLADRDYVRKRKVQWDASRGETRLDDEEPSRPPGSSSWSGWLAVLVAVVVAGLWWYRAGAPSLPTVEVPSATVVQDAPGAAVAMVESENPVLVGRVTRVLDGDTIEVALSSGPMRVRFGSVDAPEKNQPWGNEARAALRASSVTARSCSTWCRSRIGTTDWWRWSASMTRTSMRGWCGRVAAWAYREYAKDPNYCAWEAEARSAQRGLWALPAAQRHAPWNSDPRSVDGSAASPTIRTRRSRSASPRWAASRCRCRSGDCDALVHCIGQ